MVAECRNTQSTKPAERICGSGMPTCCVTTPDAARRSAGSDALESGQVLPPRPQRRLYHNALDSLSQSNPPTTLKSLAAAGT